MEPQLRHCPDRLNGCRTMLLKCGQRLLVAAQTKKGVAEGRLLSFSCLTFALASDWFTWMLLLKMVMMMMIVNSLLLLLLLLIPSLISEPMFPVFYC